MGSKDDSRIFYHSRTGMQSSQRHPILTLQGEGCPWRSIYLGKLLLATIESTASSTTPEGLQSLHHMDNNIFFFIQTSLHLEMTLWHKCHRCVKVSLKSSNILTTSMSAYPCFMTTPQSTQTHKIQHKPMFLCPCREAALSCRPSLMTQHAFIRGWFVWEDTSNNVQ